MKLEQIQLPVTNRLYADYVEKKETITQFFDYKLESDAYKQRAQYLKTKQYKFQQLAEVIRQYMEPFGITASVEENIQRLANGAYAVVGGQQAGILTGPLYSVHKAITVLLLAKEQEQKLQMPIVPIFWIAGEDHDIEEINHTYTIAGGQVKKRVYSKRSAKKWMASETKYDQDEMVKTIRQIFTDFGETEYTKTLLEQVLQFVESETTFTDLFTKMMNDLFGNHGLLMIDAANDAFRSFETSYFEQIIDKSQLISQAVEVSEQALSDAGYGKPIEASSTNVNLFYVKEGERYLLEWHEGFARNNVAQVKFTINELKQLAIESPQHLSNNVVTRPIMQELTLPVLSFVGGPGELAYWSTLKPAFHLLNLQMPIFTPRLHISLISRKVQSILDEQNLSVIDVMTGNAERALNEFIESIQDKDAIAQLDAMEQTLKQHYDELQKHLNNVDVKINPLLERNEQYHIKQFDYLRIKVKEQIENKHSVKINQFKYLMNELKPLDGLQERNFNPYMYLNEFGPTLIDEMLVSGIEPNTYHNVLYL